MTEPARISFAAAHEWCAAHGFNARDVAEVIISLRTDPESRAVTAWAEFVVYRLNEHGARYVDPDHPGQAAAVPYLVPLRSFPPVVSNAVHHGP